nr:polysaccharide deacetylase family protein [uncultured Leptotrichia sp.]
MLVFLLRQVLILLVLLVLGYIVYNKSRKKFFTCLMYHSVYKVGIPGIISTEEFEEQMKVIKDKKTFKMEELKGLGYKLPENSVLVTFDDGYKNNYVEAFPILKKYGIKATIFLNTKYIGKNDFYLNWDQVREMYDSGLVDFQMHTHSHAMTLKHLKVTGFYDEESSPYFRRESYSMFFDDFYEENVSGKKMDRLPICKSVSQISIPGHKPKKDFAEKYRKIEKSEEFQKKSLKERKKFLTKLFKEKQDEFFYKVSEEEFKKTVEFEILENKRIIQEKLNKTPDCLAYPWGHRYKGNREDLRKLGVDIFITTRKGANSLKINKNWVYRLSADDYSIEDFKKELNNGTTAIYRKIFK